jgi:hypothetical protein
MWSIVLNMDRQRQSSLPCSLIPYLYSGPQDALQITQTRLHGPLHPVFPPDLKLVPPLSLTAATMRNGSFDRGPPNSTTFKPSVCTGSLPSHYVDCLQSNDGDGERPWKDEKRHAISVKTDCNEKKLKNSGKVAIACNFCRGKAFGITMSKWIIPIVSIRAETTV